MKGPIQLRTVTHCDEKKGPDSGQSSFSPRALAMELATASHREAVLSMVISTSDSHELSLICPALNVPADQVISMTSQCQPPKVILFYPLSETLSCIRVRKLYPSLSSLCAEREPGDVMKLGPRAALMQLS